MALSLGRTSSWSRTWISGRIHTISKNAQERFRPRTLNKGWIAVFFLVLSILLAICANELTKNEAVNHWIRNHPPSEKAFRYAMESRGFRQIREPTPIRKALITLPASLEEASTFWITQDG